MGIIANAVTIALGGLIGSIFKKSISKNLIKMCGICLILVSAVGFFQNVYTVDGGNLASDSLILIVISLTLGYLFGHIINNRKKVECESQTKSAFYDSTMFFAIGGLQISGSVLLALKGDSSMLYVKSAVDFPFAVILGGTLGKAVCFSAIPVALIQIAIFLASKLLGGFITETCIKEICATAYIILFFSGYNRLVDDKNKFDGANMLPSILIIIVYEIIKNIIGG